MKNEILTVHPANDEIFEQCLTALVKLTLSIRDGDAVSAERFRNEGADLADTLSDAQITELGYISNDLDMLIGDEIKVDDNTPFSIEALRRVTQFRTDAFDPRFALHLLRKPQIVLSPAKVALIRALCYVDQGHLSVADAFAEFAQDLGVLQSAYQSVKISIALKRRDFATLDNIANEILADVNAPANSVIDAANSSVMLSHFYSRDESRPRLGIFRKRIESILTDDEFASNPHRIAMANIVLAQIYECLNRYTPAKRAASIATEIEPTNSIAWVLLGRLSLERDNELANKAFSIAIELHSHNSLPYLVVAKRYLEAGDYARCLTTSRALLDIAHTPRMVAYAYELMGLATLGLNGPTGEAVDWLTGAVRNFPDNTRMVDNLNLIKAGRPLNELVSSFQVTRSSSVESSFELTPTSDELLTIAANWQSSTFPLARAA